VSWKDCTLDELGYVGRGRSKHRPRNDPKLYGGETPFIQTADIQAAHVRISGFSQTYSAEGVAQSRVWDKPTLCLTIAGENTGSTAILDFPACFPDSIVGFVPNPEKADLVYVKHALDAMRNQFRNVSKGATQDNLSLAKILSFPLRVPPLPIQQKITSIVGAYDDLIDNNRRRIALLEEAARMLYREWFVYFRFPGHEHVKMISDGRPGSWQRERVTRVWDVAYGKNLPTSQIRDQGDYPVHGADGIIGYYNNKNVDESLCLITSRGAGSGNVRRTFGPTFVTNNCLVLRPNLLSDILHFHFAIHCMGELNLKDLKTGAAQPQLTISGISHLQVNVPSRALLQSYNDFVDPLFAHADLLRRQQALLERARDLLLPRLMNGEIAV
jgi:type I restriction enzyme, S subunit